jgi:hypothetical protein
MKSMYFMDLLLTLSAISSRLMIITQDVRPLLVDTCKACEALILVLHVSDCFGLGLSATYNDKGPSETELWDFFD